MKGQNEADNLALRDDLRQPVAAADHERLPTKTARRNGKKYEQLDKRAFVYDEQEDCYWCPQGKRLPYSNTTHEKKPSGRVCERRRYKSSSDDCAKCPLLAICVQGKSQVRTINRDQHESLRERRMR